MALHWHSMPAASAIMATLLCLAALSATVSDARPSNEVGSLNALTSGNQCVVTLKQANSQYTLGLGDCTSSQVVEFTYDGMSRYIIYITFYSMCLLLNDADAI